MTDRFPQCRTCHRPKDDGCKCPIKCSRCGHTVPPNDDHRCPPKSQWLINHYESGPKKIGELFRENILTIPGGSYPMTPIRYRKRPEPYEVMRFDGTLETAGPILSWASPLATLQHTQEHGFTIRLAGNHVAYKGEYILLNMVTGQAHKMSHDAFMDQYEPLV